MSGGVEATDGVTLGAPTRVEVALMKDGNVTVGVGGSCVTVGVGGSSLSSTIVSPVDVLAAASSLRRRLATVLGVRGGRNPEGSLFWVTVATPMCATVLGPVIMRHRMLAISITMRLSYVKH